MFFFLIFTPQPLRAVQVLFSPVVSGLVVGKACLGCISETLRCKMLILGGIFLGGVGVQCHGVTMI